MFQENASNPAASDRGLMTLSDIPQQAVELAAAILKAAEPYQTGATRARAGKLARMMEDEAGKQFTIRLADEVLRIPGKKRAALRLSHLLHRLGVPKYLNELERSLLRLGVSGAQVLPGFAIPLIEAQVARESRGVILPAEPAKLHPFLEKRRKEGCRVNLNLLGEAVLGEREAGKRLAGILTRLGSPEVSCVSVKLSALFSQIHLVGFEETVRLLKEKLRRLYRGAITAGGESGAKLVNLDMEEYRDLALTMQSFREVLDEPEFESLEAGVVLQAYLPDSFQVQQELTAWARKRFDRTGAGIRLRLVKGANLAMERAEAAQRGWPQAPYDSKREVDANYKRMLRFACQPENAMAVRVGVGSHNLFDVAYALLLRERCGVADRVEFEMLEGMAPALASAVRDRARGILLYAPIVRRELFSHAMAYLVRRLDENTAPGNFLADLFGMKLDSEAWERQKAQFLETCALAEDPGLSSSPRRTQNRLIEASDERDPGAAFHNEPDTDFSLPANRGWIDGVLCRWESVAGMEVPLQVGGLMRAGVGWGRGEDPSFADREVYRFALGGPSDVEEAVTVARKAQLAWEDIGIEGRAAVLRKAAAVFRQHRGDSVGCMVLDASKAVHEADAEVSEAIDFANYYAGAFDDPGWRDGMGARALGTVLVAPPWNFPYAIPAGGCLAALMAGNAVILKPALETVLTAWKLAEHLWESGVPREVLQFLPVPDDEVGRQLVTSDRVDAVILTGAYETARMFLGWKPELRLRAETSGKNAIIITQAADLDLAIKDLVKSAFGHAGQKCSAASLAWIEGPVYDDPGFRAALRDGVESLRVGPAWDRSAVVTPLIRPPGEALHRALTTLDKGEKWLVEPRQVGDNPRLWSPGVKLGVRRGNWFARTECFGPVLGVMRVGSLDEALEILAEQEFGLTGGLHSLDRGEIERWKERVEVGNGYVNRPVTGAIVRRQPFGGWKHSSVGPGAKAGGPNYLAGLVRWKTEGMPQMRGVVSETTKELLQAFRGILPREDGQEAWQAAAESDAWWWEREFGAERDPSAIRGEANAFRYRPRKEMVVRVEAQTGLSEEGLAWQLGRVMLGARCCGVRLEVSLDRPWPSLLRMGALAEGLRMESADSLLARLVELPRPLRWLGGPVPETVRRGLNDLNVFLADEPAIQNGRIELLAFLREQSLSEIRHRYGNLMVPA